MTAPLWTVICEYAGGTYVAQVVAPDVTAAVDAWSHRLEREASIPEVSVGVASAVRADLAETPPVLLDGLRGVWCVSARVKRRLALLTIVASADL